MLWSLLFITLIGSAHFDEDTADTCYTQNVVRGGLTSQSSDYEADKVKHVSERAVDGKVDECAHTLKQNNSWWTIDLRDLYVISSITIYNVKQDNIDMEGAQIHIGNSSERDSAANNWIEPITDFKLNKTNVFKFNTTVLGRYVTVFLPGIKHLILCEVEINGTRKVSPLVLIKEKKTWEDALYHCRDNFMDLASILDQETQCWAELEAKKADTPFVWLGLHKTCTLEFWFWVDDRHSDFNNWAPEGKTGDCDKSAAMKTNGSHYWFSKSDDDMFNFLCTK